MLACIMYMECIIPLNLIQLKTNQLQKCICYYIILDEKSAGIVIVKCYLKMKKNYIKLEKSLVNINVYVCMYFFRI